MRKGTIKRLWWQFDEELGAVVGNRDRSKKALGSFCITVQLMGGGRVKVSIKSYSYSALKHSFECESLEQVDEGVEAYFNSLDELSERAHDVLVRSDLAIRERMIVQGVIKEYGVQPSEVKQ